MKKIRTRALTLLLILVSAHLHARLVGRPRVDSLLNELSKAKEDTNKCNLLKDLSYTYASMSPDTGIVYARQGLELAVGLNWKKGIAVADNNLGINFERTTAYDTTLYYYDAGLKIAEELDDKRLISVITGNLGVLYQLKGDYASALLYYRRSLKLSDEIGNKNGVAVDCENIGNIYSDEGNYSKSLEYHFKALKIKEELGNTASEGPTFGNIGIVYAALKDYPKALEYYSRALKIYEEEGDKADKAYTIATIATVYYKQKNYPTALEYMFKALALHEETGNKLGQAVTLANIGNTYTEQKNYLQAIEYVRRGLRLTREIGDKRSMAASLGYLGATFVHLAADTTKAGNLATFSEVHKGKATPDETIPARMADRLRLAIAYLHESLDTAKAINSLEIEQADYEALAEAYELSGRFEMAMAYADSMRMIKDSVFSAENNVKIAGIEMARKEYQDSLKDAAHQQEEKIREQHRRNYEVVGVGVIVLLLGFTFLLTRNNKLLDKEKQKSDNLLLNILPQEVAGQLKDKGEAVARQFDNVTVLFTDFVSFTEAGERMKPEALIEELHTCFKKFDEVTGRHNVEKIKTIGDAYLAVAGLPTADPRHAENIVKAAIEINAFMQDRLAKLGNSTFDIRIGIHSGSVVAGIVGVKKFAYDIWGDTVNTAARMEQNSEPGKINISQTTYDLVKDKFACEYRGEIDAKGKGALKMYYVV